MIVFGFVDLSSLSLFPERESFSCVFLFVMYSSFFLELQLIFNKLTSLYSNVLSSCFRSILILLIDL